MYYLCSGNKGADQVHSYPIADLCLCFHLCKKQVFSLRGSFNTVLYYGKNCIKKPGVSFTHIFILALGKTWNGMEWIGMEWNGLEWNGILS